MLAQTWAEGEPSTRKGCVLRRQCGHQLRVLMGDVLGYTDVRNA